METSVIILMYILHKQINLSRGKKLSRVSSTE